MGAAIKISYNKFDLPNDVSFQNAIAIDTEAMGLNNNRDRLCVVQISDGEKAYVVHFPTAKFDAPNLKKHLMNQNLLKIFHFGRFDIAILQHYLKFDMKNVYCTKIASRLSRTYTDMHGLKDLCYELLNIKISKHQQTSDWGAPDLTKEQIEYAASDVLYLHHLREKLNTLLIRENRLEIAQSCFDFLPARAKLDTLGWNDFDIFAH